jgi:hypothetical protein
MVSLFLSPFRPPVLLCKALRAGHSGFARCAVASREGESIPGDSWLAEPAQNPKMVLTHFTAFR